MNRFICVQMGARHGYAVPEILETANQLERLYTDIAGNIGVGRLAAPLGASPVMGGPFKRLARRSVPETIRNKTYTFPQQALSHAINSTRARGRPDDQLRAQLRFGIDIGNKMIAAGYGSATHIYAMFSEGRPFLVEARHRGITIVSEMYCLLSTERILEAERRQFPDWEPKTPLFAAIKKEFEIDDNPNSYADWFLCPSEAVQTDLVENWGVQADRTRVVPYGVAEDWFDIQPSPKRGTVLFAGTANLNKGIHYLAMAAERLAAKGRQYEFRVAGNVAPEIRGNTRCRNLKFLGRVPRDRIQEEFRHADVFALPSLAEGSAAVTYEALAAGVPVVTTKAAGSVVRDGVEGRIVRERDAAALADAIESIIEDRSLRDEMAMTARVRAKDYTWAQYADRLALALNEMR
jgi:glycosyltransferase involved in cell wall biosynthesis